MNNGNAGLYNVISILFAVLTVVALVAFGVLLSSPAPEREDDTAQIPTVAVVPTNTVTNTPVPSATPRPTLPPTFTPTDTPTITPTQTVTDTPTVTFTPSITFTPQNSPTPVNSPTPSVTPGPSPTTTPTVSPFLFAAESVAYVNNNNSAGCSWQGIGGNVTGLDGNPSTLSLQVHAFNDSVDITRNTGSNTLYGGAGYELQLGNTPSAQRIFVQLETRNGTQVSERLRLEFPGNCQGNLARIDFFQLREP